MKSFPGGKLGMGMGLILSIKWNFVRGSFVRSFVGVRPFFLYCTTVQFCCICAVDKKADHGHKQGHAPRALHGEIFHGHLKAAKRG